MPIDRQRGQALAEALAALGLIAVLGTAVISIGRLQFGGLSAAHAARLQAFRYALGDRGPGTALPNAADRIGKGAFVRASLGASGAASPARSAADGLALTVGRGLRPAAFTAPGGAGLAAMRRELDVEDRGMVTARAVLPVPLHRHHGHDIVVRRHVSILADAGHASDDAHAQRRIAASRAVWGNAARRSLAPARQASSRLKNIDRGWGRAAPDLDWLGPWSDLVPMDRVDRTGSGRGPRR